MRKKSTTKVYRDQCTRFKLEPKNQTQAEYIEDLNTCSVVVAQGPAGTGKTFIAAAFAAQKLYYGDINKIILTRPNVSTGKSLGAFPGDINDKMEPWLAPLTSAIKQVIGAGAYDCQLKHGNIEYVPIEVVRGRSWDNAIILIDESQNMSIAEFKAISTRIGENSKMVFMGDASQHDMRGCSDIETFCDIIIRNNIEGVSIIDFTIDDIVRSDICAAFVKAFYKEGI